MYNQDKAQRAYDFISELRHTKGEWAGKQWQWIPWQVELVNTLFGTVDEKGYRQYRTAYVEIPKKQGKSEIGAAIALYLLAGDQEFGAEVYSAAADREQASIVFNIAASMVGQNEVLNKTLKVLHSTKRIVHYTKNSYYHALSSESYTKHGYNIHGCIFDELHIQPNRFLFDVLKDGAGDARQQPLMFIITTAGVYDVNSIGWEVHKYAKDIKDGIIDDPRFLSIIYSLDEKEDWEDEENWRKVNPSIGFTMEIDKLRDAYKEAKHIPAKQNNFRRLRLNQWTAQITRWMDAEYWNKCNTPVNLEELQGQQCWAGLDLASSIDIAAFVLVFPRDEGFYDILSFFWIPEEAMEIRSKQDKVPYPLWVNEGYIFATPGNVIDYEFIEDKIDKLNEIYNIRGIAYDRWGAVEISQKLDKMGFVINPFGQGWKSMSPPTKALQKLVMEGKIRHGDNPVLNWMFNNIMVKTDPAENIKIDKAKSTEKVDGMVALVMGLDGALRNMNEKSVYEDGGIFVAGKGEEPEEEELTEEETQQVRLNTECPICKRPTRLETTYDGELRCLTCGNVINREK